MIFTDSQMSLSQDRDLKYDICAKQVARNLDESHQRPESVEPKSPCLTSSSFLQVNTIIVSHLEVKVVLPVV